MLPLKRARKRSRQCKARQRERGKAREAPLSASLPVKMSMHPSTRTDTCLVGVRGGVLPRPPRRRRRCRRLPPCCGQWWPCAGRGRADRVGAGRGGQDARGGQHSRVQRRSDRGGQDARAGLRSRSHCRTVVLPGPKSPPVCSVGRDRGDGNLHERGSTSALSHWRVACPPSPLLRA